MSLKNEIIDDESYKSIKKFWKLQQLSKLSELNDTYNFQESIAKFSKTEPSK